MNRRPWPIVILAVLQFLSPVIYVAIAAFFYKLSLGDTATEIYTLASDLRRFELFVLPLILGALILVTRRYGYVIVITGSVYLIVRSVVEYLATNRTDPLFPVVISNIITAGVLLYFMRSKTREVYFNPRVRWWETDPRYVVDVPSTVTRIGAQPSTSRLRNIANGGAGVSTGGSEFLKDEVVTVAFTALDGSACSLKGRVVWQTPEQTGTYLGVEWTEDGGHEERLKVRRYVRALRHKGTPTTRRSSPWWEDLKSWLSGKKA